MKKIIALMLALLVIFACCACGGEEDSSAVIGNKKAVTVVIYNGVVATKYSVKTADLKEKTVLSAMEYLNKEEGVALEYTNSEYGAYVTEFGLLAENAKENKYLYFWTSIVSDWDVSAYASEGLYNGHKIVSSGVGAAEAEVRGGSVVVFGYYGAEIDLDLREYATVVIHEETDVEYVVDIEEVGEPTVFNAMKYLKKTEKIEFNYTTSKYGAYVTEFGALKEDAANYKYIMFWTSVETDWDVSAYATEVTYKDTKLVSSGVGVSSAELTDGAIVYFAIVAY